MKLGFLLFIGLIFSASVLNDARKANEAYQRGDYEEAVQLYRMAIAQNPDDARLYFNLGNALSQLGKTTEAVEAFETYKSRTENSRDQSLADYNKGRVHTELEQYDEALSYYRDALRKNPYDQDARHNYELALRKQQEQEQEQDPQPDQDSGDNDDQDSENDQQQNPDDQEQESDQEQDSGQQPESPQDQDGDQDQQPQPRDMTREEAENLLDALEQLERELLENRKKEATESSSGNEKDW
jgi:Ca-activated chloride channel homolog